MATDDGYDPAVWRQMPTSSALQGLIVPEAVRRLGVRPHRAHVVMEEMGAALLCAPYFSTVGFGANALLAGGDDGGKRALLPGIAVGRDDRDAGAGRGRRALGRSTPSRTTATANGDGWALSGAKSYVLDGHAPG